MPSVAELTRWWSRMGKRRSSANQALKEPKSTHRSRNPSFVKLDDTSDINTDLHKKSIKTAEVSIDDDVTADVVADVPTAVPHVPQQVKDRLMSSHGVSLSFMTSLADAIEQNVQARGTRLVVLTKDINVEIADGQTRMLPAGETTARILSEDPEDQIYVLEVPYLNFQTVECPIENVMPKPRNEWTVEDICEYVVKPQTMATKLFYNQVISEKHRGPKHQGVFVSQARSTPYRVLLDALSTHFGPDADHSQCFVWLDAFCANQPLLTFGDAQNDVQVLREWILRSGLHEMISNFQEVVLILESWKNAVALTRAWCLWELFGAVSMRSDGFKVALPQSETIKFEHVLRNDYDSLVLGVIGVDFCKAKCKVEKDELMIKNAVGSRTDDVNMTVKSFLRDWFARTGQLHVNRLRENVRTAGSDVTAMLMHNLGNLYLAQSKYEQADKLYLDVLSIRTALFGLEAEEVAQVKMSLGVLYSLQSKYEQAEKMLKDALKIRQSVLGPDHPLVAVTQDKLGILYHNQGKYTEANVVYHDALRIRMITYGPDSPDIVISESDPYALYYSLNRFDKAEAMLKYVVKVAEDAKGHDHLDVATALTTLVALYMENNKYEEAESLLTDALRIRKLALGPDHPDVAVTETKLGNVYKRQLKYKEAESMYLDALRIVKATHGIDHPNVANAWIDLGLLYYAQQKYKQAEEMYFIALTIRCAKLGKDHPDVAMTQDNLGVLYSDQKLYAEAESMYLDALNIRLGMHGGDHPVVAWTKHHLGQVYVRWPKSPRFEEAEALFLDVKRILQVMFGDSHVSVAWTETSLGALYVKLGRFEEAEDMYQDVLRIRLECLGPNHADVALVKHALGTMYQKQGKLGEAEAMFVQALDIHVTKYHGSDSQDVATAKSQLGDVYRVLHKYDQTEVMFRQTLNARTSTAEQDFLNIATAALSLGTLYHLQGNYDEAESMLESALEIRKEVYGEDKNHEHIAQVHESLGDLYASQSDKLMQAEQMYLEALAALEILRLLDASRTSNADTVRLKLQAVRAKK